MPKETTIRAIGNSAGVTLPKALLKSLNLSEGDTVHVVEVKDGILLTPYDPEFNEAMDLYREGAGQYRNALRQLAK